MCSVVGVGVVLSVLSVVLVVSIFLVVVFPEIVVIVVVVFGIVVVLVVMTFVVAVVEAVLEVVVRVCLVDVSSFADVVTSAVGDVTVFCSIDVVVEDVPVETVDINAGSVVVCHIVTGIVLFSVVGAVEVVKCFVVMGPVDVCKGLFDVDVINVVVT